jgi:putative endonuclease
VHPSKGRGNGWPVWSALRSDPTGHDGFWVRGWEKVVTANSENVFIAVYMMTNKRHGTLYTGVTSWLPGRAAEHREGRRKGFTQKYGLHRLVWYEQHPDMKSAIQRETSIKRYKREWKINLIERENPDWSDLYPGLVNVNRNSPLLK